MYREIAYIIQYSLNSTFNLYRREGKNLYPLSFALSVLLGFGSLLAAFTLTYGTNLFFEGGEYLVNEGMSNMLNLFVGHRSFFWNRMMENAGAIVVFSYAVYALYLAKCIKAGFPRKPGLKNFFASFSQREWKYAALLLGGLLVFNFLLYSPLFSVYGNLGWIDLATGYTDSEKLYAITSYLNKLAELLKHFAPYFAAVLFLYLMLGRPAGWLRNNLAPVAAAMFLCFILDMFSSQIVSFISEYLVGALTALIPFRDALIPAAFLFCLMLVVIAFLFLASASFLYYPLAVKQAMDEEGIAGRHD